MLWRRVPQIPYLKVIRLVVCGGLLAALGALAPAPLVGQDRANERQEHHDFFVRPGTVLQIRVWPDSTLGGHFPVEETGYVYLPVVGQTSVDGKRLSELRDFLRARYSTAIKSAIISITPVFNVSVLGSVQQPGSYSADPTTSLFDVLTKAGGFAPGADQERVRVLRSGSVIELDAKRALDEGTAELALLLQPGDRILVPARPASIFRHLSTALSLVQTVLLLASLTR